MKKRIFNLSFFLLVLCFQTVNADVIGKIPLGVKSDSSKVIEFTFPDGWFSNKKKNPFDLQYFSRFEQITTGVFLYQKIDLSSSYTARKLLDVHINDLKSKRDKFEIFEAENIIDSDEKKIITIVYSGEKGASRYYYKLSVIETKKSADAYMVTIQTLIPSQWKKSKKIVENILASVQVK